MGRTQSLKKKLTAFKNRVNASIPIDKMILFGSGATGDAGKDSDIDLIIVSRKFNGLDFFQRGAKMYDYWGMCAAVDFLCYTPKEFDKLKKQVSIISEALKYGVMV